MITDEQVREWFKQYLISHDQGILSIGDESEIDVAERAFQHAIKLASEHHKKEIEELQKRLDEAMQSIDAFITMHPCLGEGDELVILNDLRQTKLEVEKMIKEMGGLSDSL